MKSSIPASRTPQASRGFALVIFLALTPIVTVMAWTFVSIGTVTRAQALAEERRIRALFAAEAALRCHLLSGQPQSFQLNGCKAEASSANGGITGQARPLEFPRQGINITLRTDRGIVVGRTTDEEEL